MTQKTNTTQQCNRCAFCYKNEICTYHCLNINDAVRQCNEPIREDQL